MDDRTAELLKLRAMNGRMRSVIDHAIEKHPMSSEDRLMMSVSALVIDSFDTHAKGDTLRWCRAVQGQEEAWLILHSLPGAPAVEAVYYGALSREMRGLFGR